MVTTRDGIIQAQESFCLCKLDPEYMRNPNWQQGIVLVEVINGIATIEAIPFNKKKNKLVARWRGEEYLSK